MYQKIEKKNARFKMQANLFHVPCTGHLINSQYFRQLERGNLTGKPRGIFYFTHTFTLLSLFTAMGIANDADPLVASNYRQMTKRQFRTSLIAPFNANLVAVFYRFV